MRFPTGRGGVATGIVLLGAGLLFAASASASGGLDLRADRATELRGLVRIQAQRTAGLEAEVAQGQADLDALASAEAGTADGVAARARIRAAAAPAGLMPQSGPGLTVTLDDAPKLDRNDPLADRYEPDDLVVHQQDVQAVVNAMWRGGATAMQIMDQRIVSTSAVRCVGNTIILQGRVYSPPFRITAIGDPTGMVRSLDDDPGVSLYRSWASIVGLVYDVQRQSAVTVPAYDGSLSMAYATPAPSRAR